MALLIDILLKFADDTKGRKVIESEEDRQRLQETLDKLYGWAEKWGMKFNLEKCKIMHVGRNNPGYRYSMGGVELAEVEEERDVGVVIHKSLKPGKQCKKAATTATAVLNQITKNFHFRDRHVFIKLYKQYVRPHVEFSTPAWSPWSRCDINVLESVQRKAVRMVAGLEGTTYEDRCRELGLDTLERRRWIQDMTQTHKIIHRRDKLSPTKLFTLRESSVFTRTAEDPLHLDSARARLDIRRNCFSMRVVNNWNNIQYSDKSRGMARFRTALKNSPVPGGEPHDNDGEH